MEASLREARETGNAAGAEAVGSGVKGREEAALEDGAEGSGCHAGADPDAGETELRDVADVGAVEDFPVLEIAAAAEADAQLRLARQIPDAIKAARADYVIDNSGDKEALLAQVEKLWQRLRAESNKFAAGESLE